MRYHEAVEDCEAAIGLKPDYDKAWNRLGCVARVVETPCRGARPPYRVGSPFPLLLRVVS